MLNVVVRDEKMGAAPSSRKNEIQNIFFFFFQFGWPLKRKSLTGNGKIFMVKSSGEEINKKFSLKKVRRRKVSTWEIFKNSVVATTMCTHIKIHFAWSLYTGKQLMVVVPSCGSFHADGGKIFFDDLLLLLGNARVNGSSFRKDEE